MPKMKINLSEIERIKKKHMNENFHEPSAEQT